MDERDGRSSHPEAIPCKHRVMTTMSGPVPIPPADPVPTGGATGAADSDERPGWMQALISVGIVTGIVVVWAALQLVASLMDSEVGIWIRFLLGVVVMAGLAVVMMRYAKRHRLAVGLVAGAGFALQRLVVLIWLSSHTVGLFRIPFAAHRVLVILSALIFFLTIIIAWSIGRRRSAFAWVGLFPSVIVIALVSIFGYALDAPAALLIYEYGAGYLIGSAIVVLIVLGLCQAFMVGADLIGRQISPVGGRPASPHPIYPPAPYPAQWPHPQQQAIPYPPGPMSPSPFPGPPPAPGSVPPEHTPPSA